MLLPTWTTTTVLCLHQGVSILLKLSLSGTVVTTPQCKQHKIPSQDSCHSNFCFLCPPVVVADAVWHLANGIPSRLSSSLSLLWKIGQSMLGKYVYFKAIVF